MGPLRGLIGFWPFTSTWMLWWAAAAIVPILLHFWNRRRYQEVPWAAMEYLLAAVRKHARRLRIEHLVLLAIRVAILVLVALALANPVLSVLPDVAGSAPAVGNAHTVIVVDGSYSMDYRGADRTRFARAKERAIELIEKGRQGDGFTLICMAQPPRSVIGHVAFDPDDVVRELEQLQRTDEGADLLATCALVENVLERARRGYPRLADHRVCFLTDLGRNTWEVAATDAGRAALARIGDLAELQLVDLGEDDATNLAVVNISARPAVATVARPVQIEVQIENFAMHNREGIQIELLVDGQQAAVRRVAAPAGGQAMVSMGHQFMLPGEHVIEARLDGDRLVADDRRWLCLLVRPALRVLCIEGKPGAATNVKLALEPAKSRTPRIEPRVDTASALLDEDLRQYDAIFICNVARLGRRQADLLRKYVQRGGGVVWFLGDQVDCDNYNRVLRSDSPEQALLPAKLLEVMPLGQYQVDPLSYRHPIVAPFRGNERAGLLTTPVWKYVRAVPIPGNSVEVALAFQSGDPAIVERSLGRGRVIMVTTAASRQSVDAGGGTPNAWTAFPVWPSFLPLVQEMLKQALVGSVQDRSLLVGAPIQAVLPPDTSASWGTVTNPVGTQQRVVLHSAGGDPECFYADTNRAGVYRLQWGNEAAQVRRYAVNVDTRESNLERLDPEQLPREFRHAQPAPSQAAVTVTGAAAPAVLYRYLLAVVLALLLLETFLAWFFGREAFTLRRRVGS